MGAKQRTELSRVTLVGDRRRVDLVLPADEPIGRLLPDVLRLLGDTVGERPAARHLITAEGTVLPQDGTLADAGVPDGAQLRLVRVHDAPSAPVVHDVTDELAENLDVRAWRWRPEARRWTASLATIALAVTAGVLARASLGPASVAGGLAVAAALVAALGAVASRIAARGAQGARGAGGTQSPRGDDTGRGLGTTLMLTGGALGTLAAWTAADAHSWSGPARLAAVAAALAATLALLGLCSRLGRGGLIGAGAVVVTAGVWEAVAAAQHDPARLGAVMAVVSVVALGLLPRLALMAAGLTGLDDRRSGGASVSRHEVETALAATHRGLVLATVTVAVSAAAGGLLAVTAPSWWTVLLTSVLMVVLLSRSRAFPLVAEVVALLAAALVLLVRLVTLWIDHVPGTPYGPLAALCAVAVVPLAVLAVRLPEHVGVRLRRAVDLVEAVGVIALFPLAVGVFGVYARLLHQF
ncbi:type VII secretion integral membrane protein EccD [Streptomyces sp. UNOB3_S3]|uniref:type VII secretion integral membrane protein EccD n=1 Tax=Streptomyces sp. UNOB3_S3 TaxID=2871682 RepID=UPI001E52B1D5|nr:type VII secretion integral membrane protein EccD [Streptomyces sp. UNOB3_S3]MCC3777630.1 type VII secretion integral membrane protein EccD [Streptomyces sp. UNOB3_S3]